MLILPSHPSLGGDATFQSAELQNPASTRLSSEVGWPPAWPWLLRIPRCRKTSDIAFGRLSAQRRRLTAEGVIVLGPETISEELTPSRCAALGELHLRRIDLADDVRVVSEGGYLGSATRREIEYARQASKPISSLEPNLDY
jgi:hypothetical protein